MNVKYFSSISESFNNTSQRKNIIYYLCILFYFILLTSWMRFFSWSDQYFYRLYYNGLEGKNLLDAYAFYPSAIGAREPIYFFLTFIFQKIGISKSFFDIILNSIFFTSLICFFAKSKTPKTLTALLLTNLYFFAIFFVTERLKLGVLFLILYFLFSSSKYSVIFILMSVLSHAQLLILLPFLFSISKHAPSVRDTTNLIFDRNKVKLYFFIGLIAVGTTSLLLKHVISKLILSFNYSPLNLIKPAFFALTSLSFIEKKQRLQYCCLFIPVFFAALFLGEGRITLIAFYGSLYFWVTSKKTTLSSYLLLFACAYLSLKGAVFMLSASFYGDGNAFNIIKALNLKFPQL